MTTVRALGRSLLARQHLLERKYGQEPTRTDLKDQAAKYKELSLTHLARMLKLSNKKEIATLYSQQCMNMGHNDLALQALKQANDRDPDDTDLVEQCLKAATTANDPATTANDPATTANNPATTASDPATTATT